jgi:hypothetical protein
MGYNNYITTLIIALCSAIKVYGANPILINNNYLCKNDTLVKQTDTVESSEEYPLFCFEYMISSQQTPISDSCVLSGINSHFSAFQMDFNYGWYLDKKKENTILLASLGYAFSKTNLEMSGSGITIPNYIKTIPDIHHLYLNLIYNQKMKHNWEISGSGSLSLASDLSHELTNNDYNINLLLYIQKKLKTISLGYGYVTYLIGNNIKGTPIGYLSYETRKIKGEILAPISASFKYKLNEKSKLMLTGEFDFEGYETSDGKTQNSPNYVDITNFESRFSYDRSFYENLHWNIGIGYYYREMSFLENNRKVDVLTFDETLFLSIKIYCTF